MASDRTTSRWAVLGALFLARMTMALQYQAVAAVSPLYADAFDASLADIGALIGIYLAPGALIALPGGVLGRWFGDRNTVLMGMGLMIAGAVVMALGEVWSMQLSGRLLAGVGGVVLNVIMTKIVTDTFAGREMATAMGIFVNSWPVGIALGLVVLPWFTGAGALFGIHVFLAVSVLAGATLMLVLVPDTRASGAIVAVEALRGDTLTAILLAGIIWGLLNVGLAMFFAFGPALLVERGWDPPAASGATSVVLWSAAVVIPLGGLIADRLGRHDLLMYVSFACFAGVLAVAPSVEAVTVLFVLAGVFGGVAAGPVMALPAQALLPGNRALGMGVFFVIYYVSMWLGPWVAGGLSDLTGSVGAAFQMGAVSMLICIAALFTFRQTLLRRARAADNRRG